MTERTPPRRRRLQLGITLAGIALVSLLAYVGFTLLPAFPEARGSVLSGAEQSVAISEQALSWPAEPAALGILGTETLRTNGNDAVVPMASLAKLVPVVMALDANTFGMQSEYVLTERDRAYFDEAVRVDGSRAPVPVGESISQREMIELMLLASANNYALSYRDWMFGDNETFTAEARSWLETQGLSSTTIAEPTGLSPDESRSSARDLARLGMLALEHPEIAEVTALRTADIPGVGTIKTTNPLINDPGVRGLKTGSVRDPSGVDYRNIIIARDVTVADRTVTFVVAVLGQPTAESRITASRQLLSSIDANIQQLTVVRAGEVVGEVTAWDGRTIDLVAAGDASTVLTLDEEAVRTVTLDPIAVGTQAGATVGTVNVETPTGPVTVNVVLTEGIPEPDAWWRLTHPLAVWGWN